VKENMQGQGRMYDAIRREIRSRNKKEKQGKE
jgi:hypothetical protein